MKGDFTRQTFDRSKHYSSVRMQQGRVQLDADWNEPRDIDAHHDHTANRDVIGPCGAPLHDAGLFIQPQSGNLLIGAGRYYVDGILCENDADVRYTEQPDFPGAALPDPANAGLYLAYLDVWQRHLTALEDPAIREVALGGPDAATRTKTIWQVKLIRVDDLGAPLNCLSEPEAWLSEIAPSPGQMQARAQPAEAESDLCIIPPGASYRQLENQLYRVEIHRRGALGVATFKWSRDNGTIVAAWLDQDGNDLLVSGLGRKHSVGAKRNLACQQAQGDIIVHWDDDDWMAPRRLRYQVKNLRAAQADICGLNRVLFYDPRLERAWEYIYPISDKPWVAGGTLCYTRAFWQQHPFPDLNVGEDSRFVWSTPAKRLLALPDQTFYIALVHPGNTSLKRTSDQRWHPYPAGVIRTLLNEDWGFYQGPMNGAPLVSCIMPTYNRRRFVPQAVQYFLRQDYPHRELIVVDDGSDSVGDLLPNAPNIRYIRLPEKRSIGAKRNLACEAARGTIIVCWDDDDWYAPHRISHQIAALRDGEADVTGLDSSLLFSLPRRQFWSYTAQLHSRMFAQGIVGGTVAFRKRFWDQGVRFPDASLAEDAAFLHALVRRGARLARLANAGTFIYVRHDQNSWRFTPGHFLDGSGWQRVEPPSFLPEPDREFYGVGSHAANAHRDVYQA